MMRRSKSHLITDSCGFFQFDDRRSASVVIGQQWECVHSGCILIVLFVFVKDECSGVFTRTTLTSSKVNEWNRSACTAMARVSVHKRMVLKCTCPAMQPSMSLGPQQTCRLCSHRFGSIGHQQAANPELNS